MNAKLTAGLLASALVLGVLLGRGTAGGDETVPGPGPKDAVAGVPVGYEHSKAGAIRAALNYEGVLIGAGLASPATRRLMVDAMAVPSRRDSVVKSLEEAFKLVEGNISDGGFLRGVVIGYRMRDYDKDAAEVQLWEVGVFGGRTLIPQANWGTTTLRLRWASGDWKLAEAPQSQDGPTPQLQGAPTDPITLTEFARQQEEVRYAPTR